jgi:hypothetical protein
MINKTDMDRVLKQFEDNPALLNSIYLKDLKDAWNEFLKNAVLPK